MSKFKVGDKVKVIRCNWESQNYEDQIAEVVAYLNCCDDEHERYVLSNRDRGIFFEVFLPEDLELIPEPTIPRREIQTLFDNMVKTEQHRREFTAIGEEENNFILHYECGVIMGQIAALLDKYPGE